MLSLKKQQVQPLMGLVGVRKNIKITQPSSLNDPTSTTKVYWSILKTFYNGEKVPNILPLLINDSLISDSELKTNHFNNVFASQCTSSDNSSDIFENQTYVRNTKLSLINFENKHINTIKTLSVDKAHSYDNISTRMFKICDTAIVS